MATKRTPHRDQNLFHLFILEFLDTQFVLSLATAVVMSAVCWRFKSDGMTADGRGRRPATASPPPLLSPHPAVRVF